MKPSEALKILDGDLMDSKPRDAKVLPGILIISKWQEKEQVAVGHDQLWYGDFESTVEKMNSDEVTELAILGWFENDDSWSCFI